MASTVPSAATCLLDEADEQTEPLEAPQPTKVAVKQTDADPGSPIVQIGDTHCSPPSGPAPATSEPQPGEIRIRIGSTGCYATSRP